MFGWVLTDERVAVIRGRQGRGGINGMSVATFLDIVFAELWDDVGPMGDRGRWRMIVQELFVEGKDPYDITWKDHEGKLQRLAERRGETADGKPPKSALDQAKEWQERLRARNEQLIPSSGDGDAE